MARELFESARNSEPFSVITEATNMTGAFVSSEREIEGKLQSTVSHFEGAGLDEFAYSIVDRLNSFYHITKENGRCLTVSLKQANC